MAKRYVPRGRAVEALQFVRGVTTRADILAFAPDANVGLPDDDATGTDIRWVVVPLEGDVYHALQPGEFIVKHVGENPETPKITVEQPSVFLSSYREAGAGE